MEKALVVGPVAVHEFPHDDLADHGEADFAGRCAVLYLALFFVLLHGVETVAETIPALVERGAGRDHFDEAEPLLLEGFADRPC